MCGVPLVRASKIEPSTVVASLICVWIIRTERRNLSLVRRLGFLCMGLVVRKRVVAARLHNSVLQADQREQVPQM